MKKKKKHKTKATKESLPIINLAGEDLKVANLRNDTRIMQVAGKTLLQVDTSTGRHRDAGLFFHFLTLSLTVL
ncbi:MAG: hypothetical protein K8S87_00725, partial [Planctomycetes bacterium]|nr:hypothetical protein [Planctomycetota bacterium]